MSARRRIDLLWVALLAATALTWGLGESGLTNRALVGPAAVVLALSLAKGLGIALDFMELRAAPALWRRLVVGWLLVVIAVIFSLRWAFG